MLTIPVRRLKSGLGLSLPTTATIGSAGIDLLAAVAVKVVLPVSDWALVPTGIALAIPAGHEGQVRPRSGLALKHGVTVLNSPGTIDSDFRGEVGVILINHGRSSFTVRRGERIAQLVIGAYFSVTLNEVKSLPPSGRDESGFGSSGLAT